MYIFTNNKFLVSGLEKKIDHGFGTKQFGDGRDKNLLKNYFKNKIIVTPKETHSTNIVEYKPGDDLSPNNCDGVITREKNVVLSVITADCLPIIYYDSVAEIIAISHQGWKGTLNRFPVKMIERMIELGSLVENIHCILGPAINDCCYGISNARLANFQKEFNTDFIFRKENENYFLNLYKANYLSLKESGINETNIEYFPFCTSCDSEKFWSYHEYKKIDGEMLSFVTS